jgi:uncharacterized membrane protein HdeD (DUF308 family)
MRRFSLKRSRADTILAAMEGIRRYFDRISRRWTLESAVLFILASTFVCASGILEIIVSRREGDQFSLYWGVCMAAIALLGVLLSSQVIRAVVRRQKAESQRDF